ncbi:hypothetical protein V6D40_02660 [Corynebacterium sp. Q4381]|uniref:hypothetical protein n=1 Tax=Corynebacterium sp. Marseille-Q4381 TaxID=3121597 RepID=UPI002FE59323
MTRRADEHHEEDATTQFAPVDGTDALLDALARGEDPTHGADPLAGLLLAMKRDIERPMPEEPSVDAVEPEPAEPISLAEQRTKRAQTGVGGMGEAAGRRQATSPKRTRMNPWAAGFIGAAAASALIAGSGAALYNATPGSPLWGASTAVFGDRAAAVELASTLKEIEVASQAGDSDYLAQLLQQANRLVESMNPVPGPGEGSADDDAARDGERPATVTVTVTVSPEQERPAQPDKPAQQEPAAPANPSAAQPAPSSHQAPQPAQPAQPTQPQQPAPSAQQSQPAQPQSPTNQGQASQNSRQSSQAPQPGQSSPKVQTSAPQGEGQVPQVVPKQSPQVNTQSSYGAGVDEVAPQVVPAR